MFYARDVTTRTPVPTRLSADEIATLDLLIDEGLAESRSDAVRIAIERLGDALRRQRVGDRIVDGYTALPQTQEEIVAARAAAEALLDAESWPEYEE